MMRIVTLIALGVVVYANPARAVVGDLNLDGVVDLKDFFIFADHFGQKGQPDTITSVETIYLQGPVPTGEVTTESTGLIDGYWRSWVEHDAEKVDIGPQHDLQIRRIMNVTNADSGRIYKRWYLKPTGHLLQELVYHYSTIQLTETTFGFYGDRDADWGQSTRYSYDAEMNVVNTAKRSAREWYSDDLFYHKSFGRYAATYGEGYLHFQPIDETEAYITSNSRRAVIENTAGRPEALESVKWSKDGIDWETELQR